MELRRDTRPIRMRNYGRIVQDMVSYAAQMKPGAERDALEVYIAQCMRQRNITWNRDQEVGLNRVQEDIKALSNGRLTCSSAAFEKLLQSGVGAGKKKRG